MRGFWDTGERAGPDAARGDERSAGAGDGDTPKRDWRWIDDAHPERQRAIDELLKRADFGVLERSRITHMVRTFPTFSESVRRRLAKAAPEDLHEEAGLNDDSERLRERGGEERVRRKLVRALIGRLSPRRYPLSQTGSGQSDDVNGPLSFISEALDRRDSTSVADRFDPAGFRKEARREISKIRRLYDPGGPLEPDWPQDQDWQERGRESRPPLHPFPPGDAAYKYWLNLWRTPQDSRQPPGSLPRELRLLWEGLYDHQSLSVWEDFVDADAASRAGMLCSQSSQACLDTDRTALDSFLDWSQAWIDDGALQPLDWTGNLLSVSHLWTLPVSELDPELTHDDIRTARAQLAVGDFFAAEADHVLGAVRAMALRSFPQRDQTRLAGQREDLVISVVGLGEAILVCDMRPYSRDDARKERATRTLVIALDPNTDKLGRLVRRLLDVGAARMLALRDYQYIFRIRDVITALSSEISRLESGSRPAATTLRLQQLERRLNNWLDLSARAAALNHFVDGGITGMRASAVERRDLIESRIEDLKETPIPGYQSLTSYMRRFDEAVSFIVAVHEKYRAVRDRLDEMVNLTRAEMERREVRENRRRTYVAIGLTTVIIMNAGLGTWLTFSEEARAMVLALSHSLVVVAIPPLLALIIGLAVRRLTRRFSWLSPTADKR